MSSWLSRDRGHGVVCLAQHPNAREVINIVDRLAALSDDQLARLARSWRDNAYIASARARALSPDAPLIVEVLSTFEQVEAAADPETAGTTNVGTALKPHLTNLALKAIRDAIAAAYARPILRRGEYLALIGPWRRTFPAS